MSSIISFDTLAYSQDLQEAGMDRALADVIAKRQREAFEEILDARQLVTKQDLQLEIEKVRAEIEKVRGETEKVRSDLTQSIEKLRADAERTHGELRLEIEKVRAEITRFSHQQLKWFLGFGIACAALLARAYHLFGA